MVGPAAAGAPRPQRVQFLQGLGGGLLVAPGPPDSPAALAPAGAVVDLSWGRLLDTKARESFARRLPLSKRPRPSYNNAKRAMAAARASARRRPQEHFADNGARLQRLVDVVDSGRCRCSRGNCFAHFAEQDKLGELHRFVKHFWGLNKTHQDDFVPCPNKLMCWATLGPVAVQCKWEPLGRIGEKIGRTIIHYA
jgi:hypothetical protein